MIGQCCDSQLYTITTIVLLLLIVYYDYISRWYKHRQKVNLVRVHFQFLRFLLINQIFKCEIHTLVLWVKLIKCQFFLQTKEHIIIPYFIMLQDHEEEKKPLKPPKPTSKSGIPIPNGTPKAAPRQEHYYMYVYNFFPLC